MNGSDRPLWDLDLLEMVHHVRERRISPVELVRAHLERIEALEPSVLAWVKLRADEALAEAAAAERALARGEPIKPLEGIPFGVKDIFHAAGLATASGSKVPAVHPRRDATAVARLRKAGAILLGKLTTTEFAFGDSPSTRNPWNLGHTPGGSSSGSAAAVAARMVPFALGTQTAGSLSRPAAYCGVTTLKPTYGRISRAGVVPLAWSLDHVGAFTRSAADQALLLGVLCGRDEEDPTSLDIPSPWDPVQVAALGVERLAARAMETVRGWVVGVPDRFFVDGIDLEVQRAFEKALGVLSDLGIRIETVRLPACFEAAQSAHSLIIRAEAATVHHKTLRTHASLLGPRLRRLLLAGSLIPASAYMKAQQLRRVYIQEFTATLKSIAALATPAAPAPAPAGLAYTGPRTFNVPFSLAGFPTIVLPMGFAESGLPVGLQLAAGPLREEQLVTLAVAYQAVTSWHRQLPRFVGEPAAAPVW